MIAGKCRIGDADAGFGSLRSEPADGVAAPTQRGDTPCVGTGAGGQEKGNACGSAHHRSGFGTCRSAENDRSVDEGGDSRPQFLHLDSPDRVPGLPVAFREPGGDPGSARVGHDLDHQFQRHAGAGPAGK